MSPATFLANSALSAIVIGSVAPLAAGQSVRVIAVEASIYLNPDTTSHVLTVAKAGTLLETAGQKGSFCLVVLAPDASGVRRVGYVAATAVERVASTTLRPADRSIAPSPSGGVPKAQPWTAYGFELGGFFGRTWNLPGLNEPFGDGLGSWRPYDVRFSQRLSMPWTASISAGSAIGRHLVASGEFSYTRAADEVFTVSFPSDDGWEDVSGNRRADLYAVTFVAHVIVPLRRVVPYAGGGLGAMWVQTTGEHIITGSGFTSRFGFWETRGAQGIGFVAAGARVFVTRRFGVRPEFRVVFMPDAHYYRFGIGVFGRF